MYCCYKMNYCVFVSILVFLGLPQLQRSYAQNNNCSGIIPSINVDVTDETGVMSSPNYPLTYPPNINCLKRNLIAPIGYQIVLKFLTFSLEQCDGCACDYVIIIDYDKWSHENRSRRYCGSTLPSMLRSSSNQLSIILKSDGSKEGSGFSATFEKVYDDSIVLLEKLGGIEIVMGQTVNISCGTNRGQSHRLILWTHNGDDLNGEQYSIQANGNLRISNVSVEDSGNYTCQFRSDNKPARSASVVLTVRQQTIIEKSRSIYEASVRDSISIICAISEKDDALQTHVDWKFEDEFINSSDSRVSIKNSKSGNSTIVSRLAIVNVSQSDAGSYRCIARTRLDEDTYDFQLYVVERPGRPIIRDVECYPTEAKISWSPSYDNGASPIYTIRYETSVGSGVWETKAVNVSSVDRDYSIPMRFGVKYRFRILARNINGLSNFWYSYSYQECTATEAVPSKNPDYVTAKFKGPSNIVISWTPLPEHDHRAPNLYYEIWYKPNLPNTRWEKRTLQDWRQGEYVANVSSSFEEYVIMVIVRNVKGRANGPVPKTIVCTLERETRLLNGLDDIDISRVGNPVEENTHLYDRRTTFTTSIPLHENVDEKLRPEVIFSLPSENGASVRAVNSSISDLEYV